MSDELQTLWKRSDDHTTQLNKLHTQTTVNRQLLEQLQSEFRAALSSQSASNSELKTSIDGYAEMVNQVLVDHHEQRGAARVMKWVTGTLLTAGALWVGISSIPPG